MKLTGHCAHPSPGSHRYCDELVKDTERKLTCECPCHTDMAPFDELDKQLRERHDAELSARRGDGLDEEDEAIEP